MVNRSWRLVGVCAVLLPVMILQAAPALVPQWLLLSYLGVPGSVWLVTLNYAGMVVFSWCSVHDEGSAGEAR